MKEKDPGWFHMQDVMAAIQRYLEQEAQKADPASAPFSAPFPSRMDPLPDDDRPPDSLHLVQFYLATRGEADKKTLGTLPSEFFIYC